MSERLFLYQSVCLSAGNKDKHEKIFTTTGGTVPTQRVCSGYCKLSNGML